MSIIKLIKIKKPPLKVFGLICLSFLINSSAEKVLAEKVLAEETSSIETSYLESRDALRDYILDTGDSIKIRFKNRPRAIIEGIQEKRNPNEITYLNPKTNLNNYILDSGDVIRLEFINSSELSGDYIIDKEGEIYLPRIKNAYIKGLKISQLKTLLEKRYEEYLISPEIDVRITDFKSIESGTFTINEEGEIFLPGIASDPNEITRKTYVRGLTTSELENLLKKRYSQYFINPDIFIEIVTFKPIRVSIKGEVRRSGILKFPAFNPISIDPLEKINYISKTNSFEPRTSNINLDDNNIEETTKLNSGRFRFNRNINENPITTNNVKKDTDYITTISNAIQKAGGLTSYSDISKIEIIRDVPIGNGGGKKRTTIDFRSYITNADDTYDIRLFDGDSIYIPTLEKQDPKIIPRSILAGLTPKFIDVTILGKIESPGVVKIPIEGSLSDVMNLSGPRKPLSGKVYLIRYNQDGTILRKSIKYSSTSSPGSLQNPYLISGDLISVKNSLLGRTSGTLKQVSEPFIGIYAARNIIQNLLN